MINEGVAADELIHELLALGAAVALVSEEGANVFRFGRQAGEVKMDAADEVGVGAQLGGLDLHALPFGGNELVDLVVFGRFGPDKAGTVAHHGNGGGGIGTLKAGENRCFAATDRGDEALLVGLRDFSIATVNVGLSGDILAHAVGISGDNAHLLTGADRFDDRVLWEDLDARNTGAVFVELRTAGDPGLDCFVIEFARHGELPAFMRNGTARLQQHHAVRG